ncbi:hypothetical protein ACFE04_000178 [Oxalis oulophora]
MRRDSEKNFYEILELDSTASMEEIHKSYKKCILRWHPDKNPLEDTTSKFIDIKEAHKPPTSIYKGGTIEHTIFREYGCKRHPRFRREDEDNLSILETINIETVFTGGTTNIITLDGRKLEIPIADFIYPGYEKRIAFEGMPKSETPLVRGTLIVRFDVIIPKRYTDEQKLAINGAMIANKRIIVVESCVNPRKKAPMRELYCTLEELYNGAKKNLNITTKDARGKKFYTAEALVVDILPGMKDGEKLIFEAQGEANSDVVDIIITIKQYKHQRFQREGDDLVITEKITFPQALVDFTVHLLT